MKLGGDEICHHPAMVYPRSFSHHDVVQVVESKSGNEVTNGKHKDSSESIDEFWSELGSTCSGHGKDRAANNRAENEQRDHYSSKDYVDIKDENMMDGDAAKVIVCCKDNTTCFDVRDICVDEGVPSNAHISSEKERDTTSLNVEDDVASEAVGDKSTDHTARGSSPKGSDEESLVSCSESPKCAEAATSVLKESQDCGIILGSYDVKNDAMNDEENTAMVTALHDGSGDTNLLATVNLDKSKDDAASNRQLEPLEDLYDHGESSFSYAAGPVSGSVTYSGPIAFSGSLSLRSDSSTTSTRSFAFPILQNEWNSSPVRMVKGNRGRLRKHRGWRHGILCCRF